ncbi:G-protein coupled receptor family C group 6 member A isoform X1 [Gambusia affinis]|uniref:G-protein coupled receptor family C group 6 member A isoform X1 n=1 Tax=Gambusia affinis TaxID=33528 RepID=UPI001CDC9F45|nr:G-protein coupled receptor family C group 6 member A isoform X1 [Gambusia affinis]
MKQFFRFWFILTIFSLQVFCSEALQEAKSPGDIIIGGLFPIHESVDDKGHCNRFSVARLAQSLMMVHAIEEINQSGELGNITLGYHIVDSCGDITTALSNTLPFMKINDRKQQLTPPVMAVVGDYYSEISVAVTRQLNLEKIPEISYGSTSGFLSDKTRFPSFLRTVPEDDHQAHAIIEILKDHNWNWVGIVATDGEYGRYAVERLRHHAEHHDICFAYIKFLPEFLVDNNLKDSINEAVNSITENTNVSVIVSFTKPNHMMYIFDNVLRHHRGRNKVWIASDTWSQSVNCLDTTRWNLKDVGTIFGITLKSGNASRFQQFLRNLDKRPDLYKNNSFLSDFLNGTVSGSNTTFDTKINQLINMIYPYAVFSIELAIKAIAETVKDLCINQECDIATLQPEKFRDALKTANFYLDGKKYSFDKNCNLNSGYDIVLWRYNSPNTLDMNYQIGHYDIEQESMTFIRSEINSFYHQTKKVSSRCSTCYPGQWKVRKAGQPVCCYECKNCPVNYYSAEKDASICLACESPTHYSFEGSQNCTKKRIDFLEWDDVYHIVLLAFAGLGVLLTLVVAIIFLARWNTPAVRSSVGPIAILLLLSLLSTFGSVVLFGGQPKDWQCKARQVLFGLSFTLSVSCILVKSFKIILAFEFDPVTKDLLAKLYKPYLIIPLCMAGQVLICTVWLAYKPPVSQVDSISFAKILLLKCDENLFPAFGAMLAYIGFLAIICFILAFKGRKLPEYYNDAKFITFSMLIYLITWIIFGPVYVNVTGKYNSAIEMAVILISAYSVLFCLFFTKCYIILFKQEENTERVFRNNVKNFSMGKDKNLDKNYPSGIQNPALSMESLSSPEPLHPVIERRESLNSIAKPFFQSPILDQQPPLLQDEAQ